MGGGVGSTWERGVRLPHAFTSDDLSELPQQLYATILQNLGGPVMCPGLRPNPLMQVIVPNSAEGPYLYWVAGTSIRLFSGRTDIYLNVVIETGSLVNSKVVTQPLGCVYSHQPSPKGWFPPRIGTTPTYWVGTLTPHKGNPCFQFLPSPT